VTQHNGTKVETDKQYQATADLKHKFRIYKFTISYIMAATSQMECGYPKYVLESSDGSYRKERSVGGDLCDQGQYMQLRFELLKPGKTYKLTRYIAEGFEEVVFDNAPFDKIVDQERGIHKILEDHAYGEFLVAAGPADEDVSWGPDAGSES
jgi:hypothetical protein